MARKAGRTHNNNRTDSPPCDGCGRRMPRNDDGSLRAHRTVADHPAAPYCEHGADPRLRAMGNLR